METRWRSIFKPDFPGYFPTMFVAVRSKSWETSVLIIGLWLILLKSEDDFVGPGGRGCGTEHID